MEFSVQLKFSEKQLKLIALCEQKNKSFIYTEDLFNLFIHSFISSQFACVAYRLEYNINVQVWL